MSRLRYLYERNDIASLRICRKLCYAKRLDSKQNLFTVCQSRPAGITVCNERIKRGLAINHNKGKEDPLLRNRNKDPSGQKLLILYCIVSSLHVSNMC